MKIPEKSYTLGDFNRYLIDHSDEVFKDDIRRNWLKIYCLLVSDNEWRSSLFDPEEIEKLGEVYKVEPKQNTCSSIHIRSVTSPEEDDNEEDPREADSEQPECYYLAEYAPGLLLMYTTANNHKYRRDLGQRIARARGTTQMWLKPNLFGAFWKGIVEETNGTVYFFSARRSEFDETPGGPRPNFKRRLNYTGNDSIETMNEVEESYGVIPRIVYVHASRDLDLRIRNDGLYAARRISPQALNLFFHNLDSIKEDVLRIWRTSNSFSFRIRTKEGSNIKSFSMNPGKITLRSIEMDEDIAAKMRSKMSDFSLIDVHTETGSFGMTATVVDEIKKSVFDITTMGSQILIVPKYRVTRESFLRFYREIVESIDETAEISMVGGSD